MIITYVNSQRKFSRGLRVCNGCKDYNPNKSFKISLSFVWTLLRRLTIVFRFSSTFTFEGFNKTK